MTAVQTPGKETVFKTNEKNEKKKWPRILLSFKVFFIKSIMDFLLLIAFK